MRTDFAIQQLPATPLFSGLTGKNTVATDPVFGTKVLRVTDGTSGSGNHSDWTTADAGSASIWNADDTLLAISANNHFLCQFDHVAFQAKQLSGPGTNLTGAVFFSVTQPGVLYIFSPSLAQKSAIVKLTYSRVNGVWTYQSRSTVCDFSNAGGGPLPVGYVTKWVSSLRVSNDDSTFTVGFGEGPQGSGYYIGVYKVGSGYRLMDTRTGAVTGNWGALGTAKISTKYGLVFPFYLHAVDGLPNPNYSFISCDQPGSHSVLWPNAGLTLIDGGGGPSHSGKGVSRVYWNTPNGGKAEAFADFSSVIKYGTIANEPGGQTPPQNFVGDPHYSTRPTTNDSQAITWSTFGPVGKLPMFPFTACWQGELIGWDFTGGVSGKPMTAYRACHTYNSGKSLIFVTQNSVAVGSNSGKYIAFCSDMAGAGTVGPLGSHSGAATGTVGLDARGDVFIAEVIL
jgi:hypothetical protein